MPDLGTAAVMDWLNKHEIDASSPVDSPSRHLEGLPEISEALQRCGSKLDQASRLDSNVLSRTLRSEPARDELRQIMGQLGSARILRLLGWMLQEGPPGAEDVVAGLVSPEPTGAGQFIHATLARAARPNLVARLFAPDRLASVHSACQKAELMREAA